MQMKNIEWGEIKWTDLLLLLPDPKSSNNSSKDENEEDGRNGNAEGAEGLKWMISTLINGSSYLYVSDM